MSVYDTGGGGPNVATPRPTVGSAVTGVYDLPSLPGATLPPTSGGIASLEAQAPAPAITPAFLYDLDEYNPSRFQRPTGIDDGGMRGPQGIPGADGPAGAQNVFIQQAQPVMATEGMWVELNPDGSVKTIWVGTT